MSNIPSREEVEAAISERKGAYKILVVESQANRILKALFEACNAAEEKDNPYDRIQAVDEAMDAASALYEGKP